jgi:Fe-S-cluster containining protein
MEGPTGEEIIPSAPERRKLLITEMQQRAEKGHHCGSCSGVCCTYLANSMQITPVEALDLKKWLENQGRWNHDLSENLKDCVKKFRLDQDLGDGRRSLRRTYTCPFYRNGPQGCSISRHHKPYGCLAFNARSPGITEGGNCASDQALLEEQISPAEDQLNRQLKEKHKLLFDKAPIPVALLAL